MMEAMVDQQYQQQQQKKGLQSQPAPLQIVPPQPPSESSSPPCTPCVNIAFNKWGAFLILIAMCLVLAQVSVEHIRKARCPGIPSPPRIILIFRVSFLVCSAVGAMLIIVFAVRQPAYKFRGFTTPPSVMFWINLGVMTVNLISLVIILSMYHETLRPGRDAPDLCSRR